MPNERRERVRAARRPRELAERLDDREVRFGGAVLLEAGAAPDDHPALLEAVEERADERRLADPGLPGDEAELPTPRARTLERRAQQRELRVAADDERIDVGARRAPRHDVVAELGHEPVAAPDHGLDDTLAEHLP